MDRITEQYLAETALRTAVADAPLPRPYRDCWASRHLSRPLFANLTSAAADVCTLFDLLVSLPDRLFDGDLCRYTEALGIDPRVAALLRRCASTPVTRYGRADLYHDGHAFRLLEFNVASELGGLDRGELGSALLDVPAFGEFARAHALSRVDPGAAVTRAIRTAAPVSDPVVAIVFANGGLTRYRPLVESAVDTLRRQGLEVHTGELRNLTVRGNRIHLNGTRVDVVVRYFTADHLLTEEDTVDALLRAHKAGTVLLWTTPDSSLYSNKGALALLSTHPEVLDTHERTVVDRLLPWTRLLTPTLVEHCVAEREHMILKPSRDFGGTGIVAGWECEPEKWLRTLTRCAAGGHVVQQRVVPMPEPMLDPTTGTRSDWTATWGMFLTPDGYAGTDIRALPTNAGAVVNLAAAAEVRVTGVFEHPPLLEA